jgi:hypothetical protein
LNTQSANAALRVPGLVFHRKLVAVAKPVAGRHCRDTYVHRLVNR